LSNVGGFFYFQFLKALAYWSELLYAPDMSKRKKPGPHSLRRRVPKRRAQPPLRESVVVIDRLGSKGDGIAQIDGGEIAVPGALPGEEVRVSHDGQRGRVKEILQASPDRQEAACPHYSECGGCQTQHMTGEAAAKWRLQSLEDIFARAGFVNAAFLPPLTSPLASRRRASFSAERHKGKVTVGFNQRGSHKIIDIEKCLVLQKDVLAARGLVEKMVRLLATGEAPRFSALVTLLENGLDIDLAGRIEESLSLPEREGLGALLADSDVARLTLEGQAFYQKETPMILLAGFHVPFPAGGFLQATKEAQKALQDYVVTHCAAGPALDLYAGCGTFALPLARMRAVHAVELAGEAMDSLAVTAKNNQGALKKLSCETRNLEQSPLRPDELAGYETIILDPPRGGAAAQIREIAASAVKKVIYISCNPKTFARDAKVLRDAGFALGSMQLVDQFRFSAHVELATVLVRDGG
jgi:23S rRNA (uracil1939-C5)-methyltransferase